MTRRSVAAGLIVLAAVLVGLGVFFAHTGLERGDRLASVLSLFLNVVGVASGIAGALAGWLAWRDSRSPSTTGPAAAGPPAGVATGTGSIRTGSLNAGGNINIAGGDMYFGGDHHRPDEPRRSA
ncbi:hypothetical protein [Micromonospora echinospora]|uniref:hypothetical protein n=1 Tax=Micromonospora echinospora TaxID=1877 RepID=UPI003A85AC14